jgi:hypothetical protein
MDLTKRQIERQDFVDNSIFELLEKLNPDTSNNKLCWNIDIISKIREIVRLYFENNCNDFSEQDYYPFIKE